MLQFLKQSFATGDAPAWSGYLCATLFVVTAFLVRLSLGGFLPGYPFLLFFLAIIASAVLFDRGAGFYSVVLSGVLSTYFFLDSAGTLHVEDPYHIIGLIFFLIVASITAALIEALHRAIHDLTEANRRLAASDQEKDVLLAEAGHRMRNDLAILSSVVRTQERAVQDPTARAVLASTADRIHVLGRLHERLRRDEDGTSAVVNMAAFIPDLCGDIKATLVGLRPIGLKVEAEHHSLPQERAVSVGLIVNELVTNALKAAFPDDRSGTIEVRFAREGADFVLTVLDDGVGITPDQQPQGTGLGQRLVRSLVAQLGGALEIGPNGSRGTRATVRFPVAS
jgi:two-component sensor histidine kinase